MEDFKPHDDQERLYVELYDNISKVTSEMIRGLKKEERLPYLRAAEPSDLSLMNLYLQALKKEDYETCIVAKALLLERGFKIPK